MTHPDDETLSALIDGELGLAAADAAKAHAASCPACAGRLEKLSAASAAFKRSGSHEMPPGLAARAKAGAKPPRKEGRYWSAATALVGAATFAALVLFGGVALKKFMPTLFNNIQQMITGAASQMGSGGNK